VKWSKRGWRKSDGPLLNTDLWKELLEAVKRHKSVAMKYVRGHNGHALNERCDELAVEARLSLTT
jgi:ribonuclease HI